MLHINAHIALESWFSLASHVLQWHPSTNHLGSSMSVWFFWRLIPLRIPACFVDPLCLLVDDSSLERARWLFAALLLELAPWAACPGLILRVFPRRFFSAPQVFPLRTRVPIMKLFVLRENSLAELDTFVVPANCLLSPSSSPQAELCLSVYVWVFCGVGMLPGIPRDRSRHHLPVLFSSRHGPAYFTFGWPLLGHANSGRWDRQFLISKAIDHNFKSNMQYWLDSVVKLKLIRNCSSSVECLKASKQFHQRLKIFNSAIV